MIDRAWYTYVRKTREAYDYINNQVAKTLVVQ